GVFGKDNDGEQPLAPHYRTDAGTPGLLGSPDTLAAVLCRFRNVEVVAVDAAVIGVDRSDAGGHEGDVPFFVAFGGKAPGNMALQVESLCLVGSFFDGDFIGKAVDDHHYFGIALSGHLQGIEPGILEEGPEVSTEVGN